jgi:hypothetical protein
MKMETACSSETSVDFQRTTRRYIPEDSTQALLATCFHAGFLFGLFFYPEVGGDIFIRNVGSLSSLPSAFTLVCCVAYSSTLKIEAMFLRNVG